MSDQELKPCPFCGDDAELLHIYAGEEIVRCVNECCMVRPSVTRELSEEAIEHWNTRTPPASAQSVEPVAVVWQWKHLDGDKWNTHDHRPNFALTERVEVRALGVITDETAAPAQSEAKAVWVLTKEVNDYNQYGEYFIAAFLGKPCAEDLRPYVKDWHWGPNSNPVEVLLVSGGDRQGIEDEWFKLREEITATPAPVKPAESGAEYTLRAFGAGAHVVIYGDFDGAPAVVIYPAKQPGEVGASAKREGEFTDADLVGAVVLTFPTKEQTWRVSDALVNAPIGAGDALTDAEILNVAHGVGSVRMMPPAFLISFARALLAKRGGA